MRNSEDHIGIDMVNFGKLASTKNSHVESIENSNFEVATKQAMYSKQ